jgi:hypothetical protein
VATRKRFKDLKFKGRILNAPLLNAIVDAKKQTCHISFFPHKALISSD